jgi:hypothetical protein
MIAENTMLLAYIDPGTGALLLQTLIAGVIGVLFYFRSVLKKIGGWLRGRGWKREDDENDSSTPDKGGA